MATSRYWTGRARRTVIDLSAARMTTGGASHKLYMYELTHNTGNSFDLSDVDGKRVWLDADTLSAHTDGRPGQAAETDGSPHRRDGQPVNLRAAAHLPHEHRQRETGRTVHRRQTTRVSRRTAPTTRCTRRGDMHPANHPHQPGPRCDHTRRGRRRVHLLHSQREQGGDRRTGNIPADRRREQRSCRNVYTFTSDGAGNIDYFHDGSADGSVLGH